MAAPAKKKKNKPKVNLKARPDTTPSRQTRKRRRRKPTGKPRSKKWITPIKRKAAKPVDKAKERAKEAAKMKKIKEQSGY